MMTGECCCLVCTNLRMYGLMTKLALSLLEYIILLLEYYVSHCILDEVVHPAPQTIALASPRGGSGSSGGMSEEAR